MAVNYQMVRVTKPKIVIERDWRFKNEVVFKKCQVVPAIYVKARILRIHPINLRAEKRKEICNG